MINASNHLVLIIVLLFSFQYGKSQSLFSEIGVGVGNVVGEEHSLGKAELYFNILKAYQFGDIGLDFSTGGNFIPGERSTMEADTEILSPNDARFGSAMVLYRLPIKKHVFIEPRLGYSSLSYFVHTDEETRIQQGNFSYGLGIGTTAINKLTLSLRYQYLGTTPEYEGLNDRTTVISNEESVDLVLLRIAYRFNWDGLFQK